MTNTIVKQALGHDKMSLSASFPSGGTFKWKISRSGETVEIGFAKDRETATEQHKVIVGYLGQLKGTYAEQFNQVASLLECCVSGAEAVGKMLEATTKKVNNN